MKRVIVVEDETILCEDLTEYLRAKGYDAVGVLTAQQMGEVLETQNFDAAILDITLPDGDGLELLAQIRQRHGFKCGVIVLTSHVDRSMRIGSLDQGADAYLNKGVTLSEIEATLRSVIRRLPSFDADQADGPHAGKWVIDSKQWQLIDPKGEIIPLTSTEMGFLMVLSRYDGKICPRDTLVDELSSSVRGTTTNVDAIVRRLRSKIKDSSGVMPPIKSSYGVGFAFSEPLVLLEM